MSLPDYTPENADEKLIWAYMLTHDRVTHADLKRSTGVKDWARTNFLSKLKRLGHLHECDRIGSCRVFTIMDRAAAAAFTANRRETPQGAMWTLIRLQKVFTPLDLSMLLKADRPEITDKDIQAYCSLLLKAGFLRVLERAKPGVRPARYRLIRDPGPLPIVKRVLECVIDTNDDSVAYIQGARK